MMKVLLVWTACCSLLTEAHVPGVPSYVRNPDATKWLVASRTSGSRQDCSVQPECNKATCYASDALRRDQELQVEIAEWIEAKGWGVEPRVAYVAAVEVAHFVGQHPTFPWRDFCVMIWRESRWRPTAVGDNGHSRGLAQINDHYWSYDRELMRGASGHAIVYQLQHALELWRGGGPHLWTTMQRARR